MTDRGHFKALLVTTALLAALPGLAGAEGYPHAGEPIGTVEQIYDGHLTPDLAVSTYRNIDRLFPTRTIAAGDSARELPQAWHRVFEGAHHAPHLERAEEYASELVSFLSAPWNETEHEEARGFSRPAGHDAAAVEHLA